VDSRDFQTVIAGTGFDSGGNAPDGLLFSYRHQAPIAEMMFQKQITIRFFEVTGPSLIWPHSARRVE